MGKAGLTIGEINGVHVDKTVRCQFCGSEMRQGTCYLGAGTNILSYHCDFCGCMSAFCRNSENPIKSIEYKFVYRY